MLRASQSSSGASSIGVPPRHPPTRCTRPSTWPSRPASPSAHALVAAASRRSTAAVSMSPPASAASSSSAETSRPLRRRRPPAGASRRTTVGPRFPPAPATASTRPSSEAGGVDRSISGTVPASLPLTCPAGCSTVRAMADPTFAELQSKLRELLAERHPALDRRRRAHGRRRALDQLRRPRASRPGLPRLRGAVPVPRPEPPSRAAVASGLRHVAADPSARPRLLLRARPGARHARRTRSVLRRLARRRPERAAVAQAARAARGDPSRFGA